jgi:hypothetical protein
MPRMRAPRLEKCPTLTPPGHGWLEGMEEGEATRLRDEVQVGTNRRQARKVRNAYDSPEGANGRALGQGNRVISDLGGSPEEALRATVKMSRNSTGRPLRQNIGDTEAEAFDDAARRTGRKRAGASVGIAKGTVGLGRRCGRGNACAGYRWPSPVILHHDQGRGDAPLARYDVHSRNACAHHRGHDFQPRPDDDAAGFARGRE